MKIKYNRKHWMLIDDKNQVIGIYKSKTEAENKLHYLLYGGKSFANNKKENIGFVS